MRVGVIGQGFVGTAVREGLKQHYKIHTYDLKEKCTEKCISDVVIESKVIFVCVPTPMKKDGSCDTSIVESVVSEIDTIVEDLKYIAEINQHKRIIVIKSTVPPGTTERLNKECKYIEVVFNPEFLTEANFIDDFKNQDRIIIGGPRPAATIVRRLFYKVFPKAHIIKTSSTIAEMVKYTTNTFLSVKVSFANEIKQVCDKVGIDYDKVTEYATYDDRLGKSHWSVPGPDGHYGFGGSCFPKDINALISFSDDLNLWLHTLKGAWNTNCEVRPEEDWKELKGRAVVDE